MRRIGQKIVMAGVRHPDLQSRAIAADAVKLAHDGNENVWLLPQMLEHMVEQNLIRRIVRPGPWECFQIKNLIRLADPVDIHPALEDLASAAQIQFHPALHASQYAAS